MDALWPWLVVAGLGALHGVSPANGWMFAAEWGVLARDDAQVRRALLPMAIGHVASIAIVVFAVAQGSWIDRAQFQGVAGASLIGVALYRGLRGAGHGTYGTTHARARHAGIALWSCLMATAHGAGMLLIPALVPMCMTGTPAREITASGSLALALAATGVHLSAMLVTSGVIATAVCRGITVRARLIGDTTLHHAGTVALAITGVLLMALR